MLKVTDFDIFERMLNNTLDGNGNMFEIDPAVNAFQRAANPTSAIQLDTGIDFTQRAL